MKKKPILKVYKKEKLLYEGKFIDLPVKEEYIVKQSIALFDDDDPCIIHKSFILKEFSDELLTLFKSNNNQLLEGSKHDIFNIVDFTETDQLIFEIKE
jgi:hypothetical protein